jgi:hypothetical protein
VRAIVLLAAGPGWALLDLAPMLQAGLIGAGVGAIVGRVVINRLERRSGELAGRRVRELDVRWTLGTAILFFLGSLGLRVALSL